MHEFVFLVRVYESVSVCALELVCVCVFQRVCASFERWAKNRAVARALSQHTCESDSALSFPTQVEE